MARRTGPMRIGRSDPAVAWGVEAERAAQAQSPISPYVYLLDRAERDRFRTPTEAQNNRFTVRPYNAGFYRLQIDTVPRGYSKRFFPFGGTPLSFARFSVPHFHLPRIIAHVRSVQSHVVRHRINAGPTRRRAVPRIPA